MATKSERRHLTAVGMAVGAVTLFGLACTSPQGAPPTEAEILAAIRKSPPRPPTVGENRLVRVDAVVPIQRGAYNNDGRYWPVRVKLNGLMQLTGSASALYLALAEEDRKPSPVEFVAEARLARNDYGEWAVQYPAGSATSSAMP